MKFIRYYGYAAIGMTDSIIYSGGSNDKESLNIVSKLKGNI